VNDDLIQVLGDVAELRGLAWDTVYYSSRDDTIIAAGERMSVAEARRITTALRDAREAVAEREAAETADRERLAQVMPS
jgi:hypothetical protein